MQNATSRIVPCCIVQILTFLSHILTASHRKHS
jgi:hypothetical protein